jgi:3-hydroxybutyryl-CoA dehydratase
MTFEELKEGQQASFGKTISESDVYLFAGVTGDTNPAHINEVYAQGTRFKRRIAHGMITAGLISAVLGVKLPGPGTIYLNQSLTFRAPVYFGDTITATAKVIELDREKNRVKLETVCVNQDGKTVTTGEALVMAPTE